MNNFSGKAKWDCMFTAKVELGNNCTVLNQRLESEPTIFSMLALAEKAIGFGLWMRKINKSASAIPAGAYGGERPACFFLLGSQGVSASDLSGIWWSTLWLPLNSFTSHVTAVATTNSDHSTKEAHLVLRVWTLPGGKSISTPWRLLPETFPTITGWGWGANCSEVYWRPSV